MAQNSRRRMLKRALAMLSAIVMLFTVNTLKRDASTMQSPNVFCGLEEHAHGPECWEGETLTCGLEEHAHSELFYVPAEDGALEVAEDTPEEAEKLEIAHEAGVADASEEHEVGADATEIADVESAAEELEFDLGYEDEADEAAAAFVKPWEGAAEEKESGEYQAAMGQVTRLSKLILATGLPVRLDEVESVGEAIDSEQTGGQILVERVENDYVISALKNFAETELAVYTASDVWIVKLTDGVAPMAANPEKAPDVVEEAPAGQEDVTGVDETPVVSEDELIQEAIPAIEEEVPVEAAVTEASLLEAEEEEIDSWRVVLEHRIVWNQG